MTTEKKTSYPLENGASVSVEKGQALDYSLMRASQLTSLLSVMLTPDFGNCAAGIKEDCLALAHSLSSEMAPLLKLVQDQAKSA